ncbi:PilT/PilU family type 4a pilus ATPase [Nocardioides sp. MAH-18]|uniref:PilT/PilU family type 4a pilus ATPase n=1 Tax=Nocardioides agri TaxID=2682843 RepID=A0A6L6XS03_9ACTN|nr:MULTISPECIES: PilT/PilU family type 4a pilus ATPase [unclassified Nocardioides]MBA2954496.1 PilT/PilU family type 4a pilus ATPase [Nocardioides sp. CGMCC 1.13656]MVQ49357.1 PilT/PilU family type 4a pilus ATPase [Nocardioides sp. MAH-18]
MSTIPDELVVLLETAVRHDASDLHLRPRATPKVRISGSLVPVGERAYGATEVEDLVRATMSTDILATFEERFEADYAISVPGLGRFRVNAFRTMGEAGCVMRRVSGAPATLAELGLPEVIAKLALRPRGLVLVTGPTGSGKTTTLAGMIDVVNENRSVHVLTLEDPIEILHPSKAATITQRELGSDTRDWGSALRAAMRQDPDVILIGELRDPDTVHSALSAAETGHAVFASMHTTDARETVQRLIDFFPPHEQARVRMALSTTLEGVVCQRLVPRADGRGRMCVTEIAVRDARLADAIADPEKTGTIPDILATGEYSGMHTFDQHLLDCVTSGAVDVQDAMAAASNPHDFSVALRRSGWRAAGDPQLAAQGAER